MLIAQDSLLKGLEVYIVGGAVRDFLLGLPQGDRDWVVVGAKPQDLLKRGFLPVGDDFPVFLHPQTKEEFALARTERKSGHGYKGFTFYTGLEVTLEQDLLRRDLTINAMAQNLAGELFDPFNGQQDLAAKCLRHVSKAFREDPVRILRLARFLARFTSFNVAPETLDLCCLMVQQGEIKYLVPERVWKELSRALLMQMPTRSFDFLDNINALPDLIPVFQWNKVAQTHLKKAQENDLSLEQRFALLCYDMLNSNIHDIQSFNLKSFRTLIAPLNVPNVCAEYAVLLFKTKRFFENRLKDSKYEVDKPSLNNQLALDKASLMLDLLSLLDSERKEQRSQDILECLTLINTVLTADELFVLEHWQQALASIKSLDLAIIAKEYQKQPKKIKQAIQQAKLNALIKEYAQLYKNK